MENLWFFGQYSDYGQYLSIPLNGIVGLFIMLTYKSTKIGWTRGKKVIFHRNNPSKTSLKALYLSITAGNDMF